MTNSGENYVAKPFAKARFLCRFWACGFVVACILAGISNSPAVTLPPQTSITLSWDPSASDGVVGYRLYWGTSSGNYQKIVDAGLAKQVPISGLQVGTTYYFAATAYDASGLESDFSDELKVVVTPTARLKITLSPTGQPTLTGTAPSGYKYQVQGSSDLHSWTPLGSVMADAEGNLYYTDASASGLAARNYRLKQTSP